MPIKLVILDRDGVINFHSSQFIKSPAEWKPIPGALEAVARLNQSGYRVVVATNQSGIGRSLLDMDTLNSIHEKMHKALFSVGGRIDAIFYCPHTADSNCDCRKPKTGMFKRIAETLNADLKGVPAIGDSLRDLRAAAASGCESMLVRTGKGMKTLAEGKLPEEKMIILRSVVFTLWAAIWTLLVAPLVIVASLVLRGLWGYHAGKLWRLGIQFGVENFLGIRPQVIGLENMPQEPCVILSKHQSAWETMTLQDYVPQGAYCVFVLKKELLRVPLIGWGLGAMKMISIDRSGGKQALDKVVEQGRERLKSGFYVIIFPEGTRVAPGTTKRYKAGGAYLATRVGCKVVPVAHNAGEFWPRQAFLKRPGTITLSIGPAFDATGMSEAEINRRAEEWIETEMRRISPHRYPDAPIPG
ncbi:hypothetical protein B566_EDAN003173 [Ephemera danica]|nr:hypothetical protein B566_EDAN003173 [Ephemera danica]